MHLYKRAIIFLLMYSVSAVLLYVAGRHAPYLLPVIWFTALTLLLCGLCYVFYYHSFTRPRKKKIR